MVLHRPYWAGGEEGSPYQSECEIPDFLPQRWEGGWWGAEAAVRVKGNKAKVDFREDPEKDIKECEKKSCCRQSSIYSVDIVWLEAAKRPSWTCLKGSSPKHLICRSRSH